MSSAMWLTDTEFQSIKDFDLNSLSCISSLNEEHFSEICLRVTSQIKFFNEIKKKANLKWYADYEEVMLYFFKNHYTPINKCIASEENLDFVRRYYAKKFKEDLKNQDITFKVVGYKARYLDENKECPVDQVNVESNGFYPLFLTKN